MEGGCDMASNYDLVVIGAGPGGGKLERHNLVNQSQSLKSNMLGERV